VKDDHIGRLNVVWSGRNVEEPTRHPVTHVASFEEAGRLLFVAGRDLQVRRRPGAPPEQLEVQLTNTATDLQDRGVLDPVDVEEVDHPPPGPIEAVLTAAPRDPACEPITEDLVVVVAVTAATHRASIGLPGVIWP